MISLLRTACVLILLAEICFAQEADSVKIVVERYGSVLFNCLGGQHSMCALKNGTVTTKSRAKRFGSENCIMQIEVADLSDTGKYICLYDENGDTGFKSFYLTVYVQPRDVKLEYNGEKIEEGKKVVVDPDPNNFAQFICIADGGFPQPAFVWRVNGEVKTSNENLLTQDPDTQLWNARSQLKVDFGDVEFTPNGNKRNEQTVQCIIKHVSYGNEETTLTASAGRLYRTHRVNLELVGSNDALIIPGETKQIYCNADGFPPANNFKIERKFDDNTWGTITFEQKYNVTEAGVYSCSAYNQHYGLPLTDYVRSQEVEIFKPETCFSQEADLVEIAVERYGSVLFKCSEGQHCMCSLKNGTVTTKAGAKRFGSENCIMKIEEADLSDTGNYFCFYDENGETELKKFHLTVYDKCFAQEAQFVEIAVERYDSVLFKCSEGQHNTCALKNGTLTTKARAKRFSSKNCIMKIEEADLSDTGNYFCLYDKNDESELKKFHLTVYGKD